MAKLWGDQIIAGKKTFSQVPKMLKEMVRQYLIEAGREDLIIE